MTRIVTTIAYSSLLLKSLLILLLVSHCQFISAYEPVASSALESQQRQLIQQSSRFEVEQTFRKPKRVAFSVLFGGSSHVNWVLSILDELTNRGHSAYFIAKDDHTKFGATFPNIETISFGPSVMTPEIRIKTIKMFIEAPSIDTVKAIMSLVNTTFEDSFDKLVHQFKLNEIDLAICDHFTVVCIEAARSLGLPYIITSSLALGPDTITPYINNELHNLRHPTTQTMTFWQRLDKVIIKPLEIPLRLASILKTYHATQRRAGIADPALNHEDRWQSTLKLVNGCFGFERGRPLGPLVELVGPILQTTTAPLTDDLRHFLDSHDRVVYVAFGQHAIATRHDVTLLMQALLAAYESGEIDAVLWSTRDLDLPPTFQITNTTYEIASFHGNYSSDILFLPWVPQLSILQHKAVEVFVTHGGAGSLYEALYAGVRLVVYPFFADQPSAAATAQVNGVGLKLERTATQREADEVVHRVAVDKDGEIQRNVERFKALVQIRAARGPARGADVVEEALFLVDDEGRYRYRSDVRQEMSFVKAYHVDVYLFMVAVVYAAVKGAVYLYRAVPNYNHSSSSSKIKTM
ncbi:MAG: hypothetical protein EXX96DRAFT_518686 [Benjaminiella poitrasii]|nr:MAG: hypothetical protein EXX96DRAFT_518686 [Benjaminiella poitrasii]